MNWNSLLCKVKTQSMNTFISLPPLTRMNSAKYQLEKELQHLNYEQLQFKGLHHAACCEVDRFINDFSVELVHNYTLLTYGNLLLKARYHLTSRLLHSQHLWVPVNAYEHLKLELYRKVSPKVKSELKKHLPPKVIRALKVKFRDVFVEVLHLINLPVDSNNYKQIFIVKEPVR